MIRDDGAPGPLMIGIAGVGLTAEDRERLRHPAVGGVILFSRNHADTEQLQGLIGEIHHARPRIPVAVDQEGGRVQRFRADFTRLPPASAFSAHTATLEEAAHAARETGWLAGVELGQRGIDLDFAPVLDIDRGQSAVIGDRAFHRDAETVTVLAGAFAQGLREAGVAACGKHYPGHGGVAGDSHEELPVDDRSRQELEAADLIPFRRLAAALDAIMPGHVIYPAVDPRPAGFSPVWLRTELRQQQGYGGAIISDDLGMAAADWAGGPLERAEAALAAGCDLALLADPALVDPVLDGLQWRDEARSVARREALRRPPVPGASRERLESARRIANECGGSGDG